MHIWVCISSSQLNQRPTLNNEKCKCFRNIVAYAHKITYFGVPVVLATDGAECVLHESLSAKPSNLAHFCQIFSPISVEGFVMQSAWSYFWLLYQLLLLLLTATTIITISLKSYDRQLQHKNGEKIVKKLNCTSNWVHWGFVVIRNRKCTLWNNEQK